MDAAISVFPSFPSACQTMRPWQWRFGQERDSWSLERPSGELNHELEVAFQVLPAVQRKENP